MRHERKAGLRLAARIGPDGLLGPVATQDTVRVLADFAAAGADWGVGRWLAVGTAALRAAADGREVLERVRAETGIDARLLPGDEEASLGLIGALNTLAELDGFAVDIGGASTEVSAFEARRRTGSLSLPLGAVNATAQFGLAQKAGATALEALYAACDGIASTAGAAFLQPRPGCTLIGIGGTVRALCKVDRHRRGYPLHATHNYLLDPAEALDMAARLAGMPVRERERLPGMAPERADLIAAGAGLLAWVVRRTQPARILVSGAGLREGLFFSDLLRHQPEPLFPDVLEASARNIERLHQLPPARLARLEGLAGELWARLGPLAGAPPACARILRFAARLREVGTAVSYYDWEAHTFYLLREARLYGLDHRERLLLAAAAAYDGPGRLREQLAPFASVLQPGDDRLAVRLGIAAALTHAIDEACRGEALPVQVEALPSVVRIIPARPPLDGGPVAPGLAEDFRKAFGRALAVGVPSPEPAPVGG